MNVDYRKSTGIIRSKGRRVAEREGANDQNVLYTCVKMALYNQFTVNYN